MAAGGAGDRGSSRIGPSLPLTERPHRSLVWMLWMRASMEVATPGGRGAPTSVSLGLEQTLGSADRRWCDAPCWCSALPKRRAGERWTLTARRRCHLAGGVSVQNGPVHSRPAGSDKEFVSSCERLRPGQLVARVCPGFRMCSHDRRWVARPVDELGLLLCRATPQDEHDPPSSALIPGSRLQPSGEGVHAERPRRTRADRAA